MIKRTLALYRTRRALKRTRICPQPVRLHASKKIGIIWEASQNHEIPFFEELLRKHCSPGVEIRSWVCLQRRSDKNKIQEAVPFLSEADLNILGKIKIRSTQKLMRGEYDFIFCLSASMPPVIQNILANCNAKVRIGFLNEQHGPLLDFMFKPTNLQNLNQALSELLHYLEKLN